MEAPKSAALQLTRRTYSAEEIDSLYEFGRVALQDGKLRIAEAVFHGLNHIAPDYAPAWLGSSYVHIFNAQIDQAVFCSRQAQRIDSESVEASLFLVACLMSTGDYNTAGTLLGEVGDRIEAGANFSPEVLRFYKAQLARFQNR